MSMREDVKAMLAGADPADGPAVDQERAQADLEAILARHLPEKPRRRRLNPWMPAVTAGTVIATVTAILLVLPGSDDGERAYAATPPPLRYVAATSGLSASEVLLEIADRTAALPEPSGTAVEISYRVWSLSTRVSTKSVTSEIIATEVRNELHADGSITKIHERPEGTETFTLGPSAYSQPAPADSEDFTAWLASAYGKPIEDPHYLEAAAHDLLTQQALGPEQRAAFLRTLAGTRGLEYDGRVTDRVGRAGQAFSLMSSESGLPTRYTFIIDPDTGNVLGQEDTLTESAGRLNVSIPAVISYEIYLPPVREP